MPVNKSAFLRYRIIDSCLTNRQRSFPTLQFIAEKVEQQLGNPISESMLRKDLQQMKETYNAPIKYERNRNGYCYTEPDFSIKEFPLTEDEIEALDFSTALFRQLKGTRMFEQFENAINKVIEGFRISKIIGKSESQILQIEEPLKTEANAELDNILNAILQKKTLTVTYHPFGRNEKPHVFSPYLLKEYHNRWYTVGYSNEAKNILTLSLDRIKKISSSTEKYISNTDFNPADFFKYSLGIVQRNNSKPHSILLSFSPEQAPYILTQPLHNSQKTILENDKEVQVELNIYITQELKMVILSYGEHVKVLKPVILRNEIKSIIENMSKIYK